MTKTPKSSEQPDDPLSSLLRRLDFGAHVFQRADYCGTWAVDTSGQQRVPFHLVTRGTGWLHQRDQQPVRLTSGDLVLFPHDESHILASSEDVPGPGLLNRPPPDTLEGPITGLACGFFTFDRLAAAPLLNSLPGTIRMDLNDAARQPGTGELVALWLREAAQTTLGSSAAVDHLAHVVFIHVLRVLHARGALRGLSVALADPKLGPILDHIHRVPGDDHEVEELAARAGMSRSSFAQRFKDQVGLTPAQYVRRWRMHTAHRDLCRTQRSVADIASTLGYESEVAFRKAFRAYMGVGPGEVRRDSRNR